MQVPQVILQLSWTKPTVEPQKPEKTVFSKKITLDFHKCGAGCDDEECKKLPP